MSELKSRFIWNTRYFHIAKGNEALSDYAVSGEYVRGLVEYVGTRETVALNISDEFKNKPPTEKQVALIKDLCRSVPNHKNFLEYEDYKKAPTIQNASELIAILSEEVVMHGEFNEAANLVEYAAKRPGAVRVGSHGLFSFEENVDLKKAQDEVASHSGNIWTHVLSLRREDADKLGYDNQASWKALVKSNLTVITEAHNIKLSNLRWYGAMHNTGTHPHIHLFVFSEKPNEGYFSNKGKFDSLNKCKRAFATKIFAADLETEYMAKTEFREKLKNSTREILDKLTENPLGSYSEDTQKALVKKLTALSESISPDKEVKYGYLKAELKELVNDIQKTLVYENKHLSELYMKWCEHQFNIEKIYVSEPTEVPIEDNKEFTPIKNYIIKVAQSLRNGIKPINQTHENIDSIEKSSMLSSMFTNEIHQYPQEDGKTDKEKFEDLKFYSSPSTRDGDICCKLADCYYYGKGTENDLYKAMMWYGIAADQYHNGIASFRLGTIYADTTNSDANPALSEQYYKQAFYDLRFSIKNWHIFDDIDAGKEPDEFYDEVSTLDAYKEFMIGKMYYDGNGVEQSYSKAFKSFLVAAENGNDNARYYIGTMCLKGNGVSKNETMATEYLIKSAYSGNAHSAYSLYKHYSEIESSTLAKSFLKVASDNGHPIAQIKVADIKLEEGNIDDAISLLELATKNNIADAYYKLGCLYNNDILDTYNPELAQQHFASAFKLYIQDFNKEPNGFLAYNIGKMYQNGYGISRNPTEAIKWYKTASEYNGYNYQNEIETAKKEIALPIGMLASTVLHIGKVFRNNTVNSNKKRYASDKKVAMQEKERKMRAGQAQDDSDTYEYNY